MKDEKSPAEQAAKWLNELRLAKKEDEKWAKRGKKIVRRYRDERSGWSDNTKRFNILWSNVQTTLPALYGKTPRAQVERRWKDQDPVGRTASTILERVLQFEIDHYGDFDATARAAVTDRLLPGRGVAWVRLEMEKTTAADGSETEQARTPTDYVFWEDFRCSPARSWEEVWWCARRVYMSRDEGLARFGEAFKDVPLSHEPIGLDEMKNQGLAQQELDDLKKAPVWEVWCKTSRAVYWVAEGYGKTLDTKGDPYGLDGFWPCPKPLYATQTTDTLVPVPDFALYQDQAEELDKLTQRISMLTAAVKVVGVYDASQEGVQRMLNEGVDNVMIPVSTWAAFGEKGGLKGTTDFLPLDMVIAALQQCYVAREQVKQVIYEVTGLSDIIRGASVASETATAQQIKSQYASLRLKRMQIDVAEFVSDMLRIKGQLIADFYDPQALIEMSGIMGTMDAQYAEAAVQMLKSEPARSYRIEVASDSLVEMDEQSEKASRMEFLQAAGQFMERSLPVAQQAPEMAPLIGEMLLFGVRAFKGGRPMEAAFDEALTKLKQPQEPKPQPPDPEQIKAEAAMQMEQMRQQAEAGKMQATQQLEGAKLQQAQALEAMKMQGAQQLEAGKADLARELEAMRQEAETSRAQYKADLDAQVRLEIARMNAAAAEKPTVTIDADDKLREVGESIKGMAEQSGAGLSEAMAQLTTAVGAMVEAAEKMGKPRRRVIERDRTGRAIGMVEVD